MNNFLCFCCSSHVLNLVIPVLVQLKNIGSINETPPKPDNVFLIGLTSRCLSVKLQGRRMHKKEHPEWEMIANILLEAELRVLIFMVGSGVFPSGG